MNAERIKELIRIVENADITSLELEESGARIRIGKEDASASFPKSRQTAGSAPEAPTSHELTAPARQTMEQTDERPVSENVRRPDRHEVKAPMLGVFYASPAPEAAPFVQIGDTVKKGDVLCIIEAMKLMNEIAAETDGEIEEICPANGQIVEFAQTLFVLRKKEKNG